MKEQRMNFILQEFQFSKNANFPNVLRVSTSLWEMQCAFIMNMVCRNNIFTLDGQHSALHLYILLASLRIRKTFQGTGMSEFCNGSSP